MAASRRPEGPPVARFHRHQLGEVELVALSDGGLNYPTAMILGNVPPEGVAAYDLPETQIFISYTILLVRTPDGLLLNDVGAGDLGRALARYGGFTHRGFRIVRIFDSDLAKIGSYVGNLQVQSIEVLQDEIREQNIQMAMVAVPAAYAQSVTDALVEAGVRAILNYAPITVSAPENVRVQYIDPAAHLQHMTYYLK